MQCSIPPGPFTQVAEEAPHASLQNSVTADSHACKGSIAHSHRRGPGIDVDGRPAAVGAAALR